MDRFRGTFLAGYLKVQTDSSVSPHYISVKFGQSALSADKSFVVIGR